MSKYEVGSQVIDIRNGEYHIIIDNEIFDELSLYYTSSGTAVPEYYLISTDKTVISSLFERQQNDELVTEWLKTNTELKDILPVEEFDINKFLRNYSKSKGFWYKINRFLHRIFHKVYSYFLRVVVNLKRG
jgi:hypothetical protein